jgi:dolichol-phosphate mannosyltransferase
MVHITAVIPIYNEEKLVAELTQRVDKSLRTITSDYRVILVDDGSTDFTWREVQRESELNKKVTGIKFSRNFGQHQAITAGINKSDSDWVIVMDGDLQDRPEVIPDLYKKAQNGFDVVFVNRVHRKESLIYLIAQRIFYWVLSTLSGINFDSRQANFSIISKKVVEAHRKFNDQARFYGSTIIWLGFHRASIDAFHGKRIEGKPSYTFKKRIKLATDVIIAMSERPLKFAVGLGSLLSFLSIIFAIWVAFKALKSEFTVLGWPSLMIAIFFTSGINLIILGVLGLYLGRVFNQVKNRPLFIIEELTENF